MKHFLSIIAIVLCTQLHAQQTVQPFIEVTGSAEMSVMPDEIELEIVLASPSGSKLKIEDIEKHFFEVLKTQKIPESAVSFISADNPYYWYYWWWDYRHYSNTRTYKLKLDCTKHTFAFIKDLNTDYIRSLRITSSTHSKITEYRKQVKIEAIRAAKQKASDLLESIGQSAGKVIEVIEIPESVNTNFWYSGYNIQNLTSNAIVSQPYDGEGTSGTEYIPTIKLRFEIKAKFEIL